MTSYWCLVQVISRPQVGLLEPLANDSDMEGGKDDMKVNYFNIPW